MILLLACILTPAEVEDLRAALRDQDGDGQEARVHGGLDCDDGDPAVFAGAEELCDGLDNDCDDDVDEGWYVDADGDGHFAPQPGNCVLGRAAQPEPGEDCDDSDEAIHPNAPVTCEEGTDLNCNGVPDSEDPDADADGDGFADCLEDCDPKDPTAPWAVWPDKDGDGFGDGSAEQSLACAPVSGFADNDEDCDDTDDTLHPNTRWFLDEDGDGYGTEAYLVQCVQPSGHVRYSGDCDDSDPLFHPGASESDCTDPSDYNCDGSVGFADNDGDGWAACEECDDSDGQIHPDATELCDDDDNDCDGTIDEPDAADASTWFADTDKDGYGDASLSTVSCDEPTGYVSDDQDCDDGDKEQYPGAPEYCNGEDDDCDSTTDEPDAVDADTWYLDSDGDGYGDANSTTPACSQPSGYVADDQDCDDGAQAVNPAATEYCDTIDNDCDGTTDEDDAADASTWYLDSDSDGHGSSASGSTQSCSQPSGYEADDDDCDDTDSGVSPSDTEVCGDLKDNDCDGTSNSCALSGSFSLQAADVLLLGTHAQDHAGWAVSWRPDSDSDGFAEVAVGVPDYSTGGAVFIWDGPTTGRVDLSTTTTSIEDYSGSSSYGAALDFGNLQGQTISNLYVGNPDSGTVTPDLGTATGGAYGESVRFLGDVTGDGYDDVAVGTDVPRKALRVYLGQAAAGSYGYYEIVKLSGTGVSAWGGDVTGDGVNDLALNETLASVRFGPISGGSNLGGDWISTHADSADYVPGRSVGGGDVDGDGYGDAVFGLAGVDGGSTSNVGAVYIYWGPLSSETTTLANADVTISATGSGFAGYESGAAIDVGDIDGDGTDDLAIGAPGHARGLVYLFYGPLTANTTLSNRDAQFSGGSLGDGAGASVRIGGDYDGDGHSDLLIGAPYADPSGTDSGAAYVILGQGL